MPTGYRALSVANGIVLSVVINSAVNVALPRKLPVRNEDL